MKKLIALLLSLFASSRSTTDLNIYGAVGIYNPNKFDATIRKQVYSKCFQGFHFLTCKALNLDDSTLVHNSISYYQNFDKLYGTYYCLQCCGASRTIDLWELGCEVDKYTAVESNVHGYSFMIAANKGGLSDEVIICPIKRHGCVYDNITGLAINCNTKDGMYLHGYTLTLRVVLNHDNLELWRSVTACSVETYETNVSLQVGDLFYENIVMDFGPESSYQYDGVQLVFLSLLAILVSYVILYYIRRDHCVICNKKLVLFTYRCYMCRFYGAEPPDPLLAQALAEKGAYLQGSFPETVPGAHVIQMRLRGKKTKQIYVTNDPVANDMIEGSPRPLQPLSKYQQKRLKFRVTVDPHIVFAAVRHPRPPPPVERSVEEGKIYTPQESIPEANDRRKRRSR